MKRILLYASLLILTGWTAGGAEVRLKSEAICSGAVVRLKDLAEIIEADEQEAAALAEISLFPVPSAGKTRIVRHGEVRELLALSDVNLKAVTFSGADKIIVRRAGAQAPLVGTGSPTMVLPSSLITPTTRLPSQQSTGVELIPVAIRPLERGAILRASDLEFRPAAVRQASGAPPTMEDLVGKEAIRALPPGQAVSKDLVQTPRLVHRGDKVTVRSLSAGVVVSITGKAMEEGGRGDNIQVEDPATREKLLTRVTGFQVVEVLGTGVKKLP